MNKSSNKQIQNYKKDFLFSLIVLKHGLNPIFSRRNHFGFTKYSSEFKKASEYFKESIEEIQRNIIEGIDKKVKYHFEVYKEPNSIYPDYYLNDLKSFRIKEFTINSLLSFFPVFMIDRKEDQRFYEVKNVKGSINTRYGRNLPFKAVKQLPFSFWKGLNYSILENLVDYTKVSNILKDISKYDVKYFEAIQGDEYYKYFNLTKDSNEKTQFNVVKQILIQIQSDKTSTEDYDILNKSWDEIYKDRIKNPRVLDLIDYINTIDFDSFVKAFTESYIDHISNYMITQVSEAKETIKNLDAKQRVSFYTDNMANIVKDRLNGLVDDYYKIKPEDKNWEVKLTIEEMDKKTFVSEKSISEVYKLSVGEKRDKTLVTLGYYFYRSEFVFERNVKGEVFLTFLKNYTTRDQKGCLIMINKNGVQCLDERLMGGLSKIKDGCIKTEEVLDTVIKYIKEEFIDVYFSRLFNGYSINKYAIQKWTTNIIKYKLNKYFYKNKNFLFL